MTHLGNRVSALVDGRLSVDATERAMVHLAGCEACRREVAAERSVRRLLSDGDPAAPDRLTSSLLALGGEHGPMAPGAAPQGAEPAGWTSPPPGAGRPASRRAVAAAGGSAAVLVSGVLGVALLGAQAPPTSVSVPLRAGTSSLAPSAVTAGDGRAGARAGSMAQAQAQPALATREARSTPAPADPAADDWWEHVVRGTRVLAVLVTGS